MKLPIFWNRCEDLAASVIGGAFTVAGSPSYAAGKFGNGVKQAYTTARMTNTFNDIGTLCAWIKPVGYSISNGCTSDNASHCVFGYQSGTNAFIVLWPSNNSALQIYMKSSASDQWSATVGTAPEWDQADGEWGHVAIEWNKDLGTTNGRALYYNAVQCTIGAPNVVQGTFNPSGTFVTELGTIVGGGGFGANSMFDNVQLYDWMLSAAELKKIMNAERGCMNDQVIL